MKYTSHGQSQSFMAAMLLPKAMEYETASRWRNSSKGESPQQEGSFFLLRDMQTLEVYPI